MVRFLSLILMIAFHSGMLAQDTPTWQVKQAKPNWPKEITKAFQDTLSQQEFIVQDSDNVTQLRLWWRSEIPVSANADQIRNGLTYQEIPEGTFLGVIEFSEPFVDFRKQTLAKGLYTLRMGIQPDIGDHKDTAPHPEFTLLTPIADDKSPETIEMKDLIVASRKTTDGDHPSVMLLFPNYADAKDAKIVKPSDDILALQWRSPIRSGVQTGTIGLKMVIWGVSSSR